MERISWSTFLIVLDVKLKNFIIVQYFIYLCFKLLSRNSQLQMYFSKLFFSFNFTLRLYSPLIYIRKKLKELRWYY